MIFKKIFRVAVILWITTFFMASLLLKAQETKPTSANPADVYCQLAKQTLDNTPGKALQYAKKGLELSHSVFSVETKALYLIGTAFKRLGNLDSSLFYYNLCHEGRIKHNSSPALIAEILNGIGILHSQRGNMDSALSFFMRVEKINEDIGDSAGIGKTLNNIANVYGAISKSDKALEYYKRSQIIKERLGDEASLNTNRLNIATIYINYNKFDTAQSYLDAALASTIKLGLKPDLAYIYNRLGYLNFQKGDYKNSIDFHQKALDISLELGDEFQIAGEQLELAYAYTEMKDHGLAIKYAKDALAYAKKQNVVTMTVELYEILANNSVLSNDYKSAYEYITVHEKYYDKLINQNTADKITELEQKFEVSKKEKKLNELNIEKINREIELYKKKAQINYILIISAVIVFLLSFFYYRYSLKQKNLRLQKEAELNLERISAIEEKRITREKQQNELLNVIINVQEEERRKIAVDIHDGLGQLLSGIKMKLQSAMNENGVSEKEKQLLKNLLELNDDSITESKNIASDLLPYNIKDFGLVTAIKNLCYKNNQLNISKVNFYSNDVPRKLPGELEITIYRITQELVNNALKHAKATEIFVQLFYRENKLILQVEDNGIGYSQSEAEKKANSMGLKNINIRVKLLSGHLEIDSVEGQGTTTSVEFSI